MSEKVQAALRFGATHSIAILLVAAGLYFDADSLLIMGSSLAALVATAWLFVKLNPAFRNQKNDEVRERRRMLISRCRMLVAAHTDQPQGQDFRDFFEKLDAYASLRPHLSSKYLQNFQNRGLLIAGNGGPMDPHAARLLDELDRLEREWDAY